MTGPAVCRTVAELNEVRGRFAAAGESLALIPTMGFLHAGHLSLIAEGRRAAKGAGPTGLTLCRKRRLPDSGCCRARL